MVVAALLGVLFATGRVDDTDGIMDLLRDGAAVGREQRKADVDGAPPLAGRGIEPAVLQGDRGSYLPAFPEGRDSAPGADKLDDLLRRAGVAPRQNPFQAVGLRFHDHVRHEPVGELRHGSARTSARQKCP